MSNRAGPVVTQRTYRNLTEEENRRGNPYIKKAVTLRCASGDRGIDLGELRRIVRKCDELGLENGCDIGAFIERSLLTETIEAIIVSEI